MGNHERFAVKTEEGYIKRKGSSNFGYVELIKADLYLSEYQAQQSAKRHGGVVRRVEVRDVGN